MLRKNAKIELLRRTPLFSGCSKSQLSAIAAIADEIDLREGHVLIRQGERGTQFFVVLEGTVAVTKDGKPLKLRGGSEVFGEISLLSDVPTTATVVATSPVRALVVTARDFARVIKEVPSIQRSLLRSLSERLAPDTL